MLRPKCAVGRCVSASSHCKNVKTRCLICAGQTHWWNCDLSRSGASLAKLSHRSQCCIPSSSKDQPKVTQVSLGKDVFEVQFEVIFAWLPDAIEVIYMAAHHQGAIKMFVLILRSVYVVHLYSQPIIYYIITTLLLTYSLTFQRTITQH